MTLYSIDVLTSLHIRPQGAYHNVVRWVHRSSFSIRPPNKYSSVRTPSLSSMHGYVNLPKGSKTGRIPIPGTDDLYVHPGWYGTIVAETEGTNESLADLQDRCGPGIFPPRVRGAYSTVTQAQLENRKVYRILRERRCVFFFPLATHMYIIGPLFFKSAWRDMDQVCQCQRTTSVTTINATHSWIFFRLDLYGFSARN